MKIKLDKTDSKVIHSNKTYDVIDNTNLDKLIVSDTILIPDGDFHQVHNTGFYAEDDLEFICVFDGGRNH